MTDLIRKMRDMVSHAWMVPIALLCLCFLSYGALMPHLGFYWDDWPGIWVSHSQGAAGLTAYAALDRPFQAWLFNLTTPLLGESPVHWHALALLARWLSAVAIWWTLRGVWPQKNREVACIAFLVAVYPGFTQQPAAWTYSHYVFIPLVLSTFSLGAMIWAARAPRAYWPLTLLSLPSAALSLIFTEYFIGMELMRPVLLWLVLSDVPGYPERFRRMMTRWAPYLAAMGVFLFWRLFLFKSARPATDQSIFISKFMADPLREFLNRLFFASSDLVKSTFIAWGQTFRQNIFAYDGHAWEIVFVCAIGVTLYLAILEFDAGAKAPPVSAGPAKWLGQLLVVGLLASFLGELPVWFVNRQINLDDTYNRYTLPAMFGACILMVGLIQAIVRTRMQQVVLVGIIVALAVGFQFRNSQYYRQNWDEQKSLFWQLSWRVPALKPGTSVLMRETALSETDYALGAPLNFTYSPEHPSARLDYWFFLLPRELIADAHDAGIVETSRLFGSTPLTRRLNTLTFSGAAADALIVRFTPPGCLRVVDPSRNELPQMHPVERAAQGASNLDRIDSQPAIPAHPPVQIFGPEPEHGWCYYFERADLFRQMEEWSQAAQMADDARGLGLKPGDGSEWLPFIEGYARVQRYDDALEITRAALKSTPDLQPAMSELLKTLQGRPPAPAQAAFVSAIEAQLSPEFRD